MTQKETEKVAYWVFGESDLSHITVAECSWIRKETQGVLSILQRLVVFLFVTCFYRKGKVNIYMKFTTSREMDMKGFIFVSRLES